jgi:two-component system, NtrC family, response regulator AtoC
MGLARLNCFVGARDLPPVDVVFGRSRSMEIVRDKLERIAKTTVPVLLQGESGTGKEVIAKLLHLLSDRSNRAWIKVPCPSIPHSLIESELFGYEKGAFTGAFATKRGRVELAHQGTLFLDEVGSLDLSAQAKLLQVLQDGTFTRVGGQESRSVDARLVSAANQDLRQQTQDGSFRPDFFFRVNAVTIDLPALRQRIEDLPILIAHFLDLYSRAYSTGPKPLSAEVTVMMQQYNWPGNIRQLENMMRSYVLTGDEDTMAAELIPAAPSGCVPEIDLANPISLKQFTKAATRDLEREIILRVLRSNGWSRQKTARWLNISYRSLLYKLQDTRMAAIPGRPSKGMDSGSMHHHE